MSALTISPAGQEKGPAAGKQQGPINHYNNTPMAAFVKAQFLNYRMAAASARYPAILCAAMPTRAHGHAIGSPA